MKLNVSFNREAREVKQGVVRNFSY